MATASQRSGVRPHAGWAAEREEKEGDGEGWGNQLRPVGVEEKKLGDVGGNEPEERRVAIVMLLAATRTGEGAAAWALAWA